MWFNQRSVTELRIAQDYTEHAAASKKYLLQNFKMLDSSVFLIFELSTLEHAKFVSIFILNIGNKFNI
jgi:hypothetical protein